MSTDVHQGRPWTLQPRAHAKPGPHFWTGQDYTSDASKALRFASQDDAQRWLNAHRHVKAMLLAVKLPEAEAKP